MATATPAAVMVWCRRRSYPPEASTTTRTWAPVLTKARTRSHKWLRPASSWVRRNASLSGSRKQSRNVLERSPPRLETGGVIGHLTLVCGVARRSTVRAGQGSRGGDRAANNEVELLVGCGVSRPRDPRHRCSGGPGHPLTTPSLPETAETRSAPGNGHRQSHQGTGALG